jgi:hypothetical protein
VKPRFEKYDKEGGSLDSDGLWYGEGEIQEADSEDEDEEEEAEELGLQDDDEEGAPESEVFRIFFSLSKFSWKTSFVRPSFPPGIS